MSGSPVSEGNEVERLRDRKALAAETAALEADEADRTEMAAVASLMAELRSPG